MASFGEKCPVCKIGKLSEAVEKKFLSKKVFYICDNSDCSAKFLERGNTAKLLSCEDNTFLDKYDNYLEKREWINIADGGFSDKEIKIQKDEEQKKCWLPFQKVICLLSDKYHKMKYLLS